MSWFSHCWSRWWNPEKYRARNKAMKDKAYWLNKHPMTPQMYEGRIIPVTGEAVNIDVRHFIWSDDIDLRKILTKNEIFGSMDDMAQKCQKYVVNNLQYVSDETLGASEFWLFPAETIARGKGDCEDGAILLASLLLNAIPSEEAWRIRVTAGLVESAATASGGGHAYVTYCREFDNEWVILDWCYLQDSGWAVAQKPLQKDNKPYKQVWFSFNHIAAYSHMDFALRGRLNACGNS